jgi:beta-phosphoglucomutase-like phosphatase (HAD superfamily)
VTSGARSDPGLARAGALGLPEQVTAGLFDLDGVLTNTALLRRIHQEGVEVFEGSRRYLEAARDAGLHRVVVSSSANTAEVLRVTGLAIAAQGLRGKPAPDSFLAGARCVGVEPAQAAVFEDALAGVAAGRAGRFGFVVGVDRVGHADALRAHGADVVVTDLAQLLDGGKGSVAR